MKATLQVSQGINECGDLWLGRLSTRLLGRHLWPKESGLDHVGLGHHLQLGGELHHLLPHVPFDQLYNRPGHQWNLLDTVCAKVMFVYKIMNTILS